MFWLLLCSAWAAGSERPTLPFWSGAGEDGVHVLYMNPALMGFDRDASYGVYYDTRWSSGGLSSISLATTGSGLGAGVSYRQVGVDAAWWSLSSGLALKLARNLSVGTTLHWQLPDGGDDNFVSWDLGVGWRPTAWLGFGGAVQNLANPAPERGVYTTYIAGLALRPLGDHLTLGADYRAVTPPNVEAQSAVVGSLRSRLTRGLWLRGFADIGLGPDAPIAFGGSLELHLAAVGLGLAGRSSTTDLGDPGLSGYLVTVPADDQLFLGGRQIALFRLEGAYPYQPLPGGREESYLSLLRRLDRAAHDPQVRGLLVAVEDCPFSFGQIDELRATLQRAKKAGKKVVVYLDQEAGNAAYHLATAGDEVLLNPAGQLDLVGLSAETQYYKGALDLVGVEAQYAQRAEYKSGPEPWTRREASGPAREEMEALLDDLYGELVRGIASGRAKTEEDVRALVDRGPFTGEEAVQLGLVNGLVYPDELRDRLEGGVFPRGYALHDDYGIDPDQSGWSPQRAVAVVVVDGPISSGETTPGGLFSGAAAGSRTVVKALDEARRTAAVKAVVLRVDSPGGSSFASDEIWRAVERVQKSGKPVIVSMGGLAASGGYYAATGADAIYALPSTITGSIGVYGGKVNLGGLYEKVGINTESVDRGRNAGMWSMSRPFDPVEYAAFDKMIGETYRQFKDRVAEGRRMDPEQVEAVARGRVWSGADALDNKLVDELGGFYDAVDRARRAAGVPDGTPYTVITYDPWTGDGDEVPAQVVRAARAVVQAIAPPPKLELPEELQSFWSLAALREERVFAMMPYHLEIR